MDEGESGRPQDELKDRWRRTLVGGRQAREDPPVPLIPLGIEVLALKAAVDPDFRTVLLKDWEAAALQIRLPLEPEERTMLRAISADEFKRFIDCLEDLASGKTVFRGQDGPSMLKWLTYVRRPGPPARSRGIRPESPPVELESLSYEDPRLLPDALDNDDTGGSQDEGPPGKSRRPRRKK